MPGQTGDALFLQQLVRQEIGTEFRGQCTASMAGSDGNTLPLGEFQVAFTRELHRLPGLKFRQAQADAGHLEMHRFGAGQFIHDQLQVAHLNIGQGKARRARGFG